MGGIYNIVAILAVVVWLLFVFLMAGNCSECCGKEPQESTSEIPINSIQSEDEEAFTCEGIVLCFRPGAAEPEVATGFDPSTGIAVPMDPRIARGEEIDMSVTIEEAIAAGFHCHWMRRCKRPTECSARTGKCCALS